MVNLTTHYLGLTLKNPLIVGSSGLTNSIENICKLEESGAGAVVLKSIFEEQIRHETSTFMDSGSTSLSAMNKGFQDVLKSRRYDYSEALGYMTDFSKEHTLNGYLKFITDVKKAVKIPVIASVNCVFTYDWYSFAKRIQDAGADAIELNIYVLPSDPKKTGAENEEVYLNVINAIKQYVSIPVSIKISYYFSGLSNKLIELSKSGVAGMVLFNRPYTPDIDIDTFEITSGNIHSTSSEYAHTLRWIAILAGRVGCDISAATGVHDHVSFIKQLLAGANTVQIASVLYKHGFEHIKTMLTGLENWMDKHNFKNIEDFRGKMSQVKIENPADYERVQFMKLYSNIE